jgi:hypothetical protein
MQRFVTRPAAGDQGDLSGHRPGLACDEGRLVVDLDKIAVGGAEAIQALTQ